MTPVPTDTAGNLGLEGRQLLLRALPVGVACLAAVPAKPVEGAHCPVHLSQLHQLLPLVRIVMLLLFKKTKIR